MSSKIIFITGCSSGIGYDAALALQARGHRVFASCRQAADLKKLQKAGLDTILLNVDDEQSIATAIASLLEKTQGRLDVLINNAGYGQAGALEDVPRCALIAQFNTNVFGLMEVSRLLIPVMRAQGQGRIINISSILGFISMPFRGAYNASKYAVEGLSDTLRLELKPAGIDVITIEPGPIESRFREHAVAHSMQAIDIERSVFKQQYLYLLSCFQTSKKPPMFTKKTDAVIHKLIQAIEAKRPKPKYPVTLPTHLFMILKRILSVRVLDQLIRLISRREIG